MNSTSKNSSYSVWVVWILLAVIISVAAFVRLYRISEYMTFLGDEGRDMLVVKRMIVDGKFTLLGPTASVGGFFLGPVYYYFMAPFLWLWRLDPTGPAVMVALFGIATVYLVFRTGKVVFTQFAGLSAAALYSISPLVITYSRSSWNPNVVPFFAVLLFWLHYRIRLNQNPKLFFMTGVVLGIGIQLHYLFLFLYAVTGLWLAFVYILDQRLKFKNIGILLLGWLAGIFPFFAFEIRHGFPNTVSIFNFLLHGKETGFSFQVFISHITDVTYRLFGRLIFRVPENSALDAYPILIQTLWKSVIIISIIYTVILITNAFSGYIRLRQKLTKGGKLSESMQHSLMLTGFWLIVPVILFGFYRRDIYDYYFGIIYFIPFLMTGYILDTLRRSPAGKNISWVMLVSVVLFNLQEIPLKYPPNNQLNQMRTISRTAYELTGGKPYNFALVTSQNSDHAYRYFFEIWGKPPVTIQPLSVDGTRESVTEQLIVICEIMDCNLMGHSQWEVAGFGQAEVTDIQEVPFVKIYRLVHYQATQKL